MYSGWAGAETAALTSSSELEGREVDRCSSRSSHQIDHEGGSWLRIDMPDWYMNVSSMSSVWHVSYRPWNLPGFAWPIKKRTNWNSLTPNGKNWVSREYQHGHARGRELQPTTLYFSGQPTLQETDMDKGSLYFSLSFLQCVAAPALSRGCVVEFQTKNKKKSELNTWMSQVILVFFLTSWVATEYGYRTWTTVEKGVTALAIKYNSLHLLLQ